MTEQTLQKQIITMIEEEYKGYVVKVQVASKSGVPDLLCCVNSKFIGIEVKREESKNNVTPLQKYNLKKIQDSGGYSMVAWNVDSVRKVLNGL